MRGRNRWLLERLATGMLGTYLLGTALLHATRGQWIYTNLVRLRVPVPFAASTGIGLLALALFWRRIAGKDALRR